MDKHAQEFVRKITALLEDIKRLLVVALFKPRQEQQGANKNPDEAADGQYQSLAHAESLSAESKPTPTGSSHTNEQKKDRFPRLTEFKPVIEVVGVALLIVYTGITIFLWHESRRANDISLQSSQREQRPYIAMAPSGEKFDLYIAPPGDEHTGQFAGRFRISNYGKTPAIQQSTEGHVLVGKSDISKIGKHWGEYSNLRTMPPGDKQDVFVYSDGEADISVFNQLSNGTSGVVVYFVVKYTDIFNGTKPTYETGICFEVGTGHKEIQDACHGYNYVK